MVVVVAVLAVMAATVRDAGDRGNDGRTAVPQLRCCVPALLMTHVESMGTVTSVLQKPTKSTHYVYVLLASVKLRVAPMVSRPNGKTAISFYSKSLYDAQEK